MITTVQTNTGYADLAHTKSAKAKRRAKQIPLDRQHDISPVTPDDHSEREPPDPLPNSAVKPLSADGSVGPPHARVGHRQALIRKIPRGSGFGGFFVCIIVSSYSFISREKPQGLP